MSNYEDCFSFCVENGQRLLELKIVCSQRPPAICAQVYQMGNNDYRIYWNVGLTSIDYFHKIVDYYSPRMGDALYKMKINKAVAMAEHDNGFIRYVKQFTPVNEKVLKGHDSAAASTCIPAALTSPELFTLTSIIFHHLCQVGYRIHHTHTEYCMPASTNQLGIYCQEHINTSELCTDKVKAIRRNKAFS